MTDETLIVLLTKKNYYRIDGTLLQPRLIDPSTGNTPLLGRWSGSDKSLNTSIYSGTIKRFPVNQVP